MTSNITGTPAAQSPGFNWASGFSNADGTSQGVLSALAHDGHLIVISVGDMWTTGTNPATLLDIMIDPAGGTSWSEFISDLVVGGAGDMTAGQTALTLHYVFPIWIPAGASIGVRSRCAAAAITSLSMVAITVFGGPSRPDMWWCGQKVESLGITAASSKGTDHTPGNSGAFSSWATVGTSTAHYGAVQLGIGAHLTAINELIYHWQIGYGSTQLPGSPTIWMRTITTEQIHFIKPYNPIWCDVPSGTTWQVRGTASGTAQAFHAAIYGVY